MEHHLTLPLVDTPLATIRYTRPDRVEVRFKPGITFTREGIQRMMQERQRLGAAGRHRVLMVMPDYVDFDLAMFTTDHYAAMPQPNTEAVAWVANSERNITFTNMYLKYFPAPFPSKVFLTEAEAQDWLDALP